MLLLILISIVCNHIKRRKQSPFSHSNSWNMSIDVNKSEVWIVQWFRVCSPNFFWKVCEQSLYVWQKYHSFCISSRLFWLFWVLITDWTKCVSTCRIGWAQYHVILDWCDGRAITATFLSANLSAKENSGFWWSLLLDTEIAQTLHACNI